MVCGMITKIKGRKDMIMLNKSSRMFQGCIILYLHFLLSFAASSDDDFGEVVFVNILYRHGDRTPIDPYPNDPYKNNSLWPVGWGQLTDIGKRGHYELGKWLRQRYSKLLPIKYNRDDIYIQSTDVDRTLMSAYSNLAGLYEPDLKTNWSPNIKWQPIPVHTSPQASDMILAANKSCPRYEMYLNMLKDSDTFKKIDSENKDLYEYLNKHSGLNIKTVKQLGDLYNTLYIETQYNFTLPEWTKKVYPQPLKKWAEFGFTIACYNLKMSRLKSGPLISDMAMHMKKKIDGKLKPDRKAWVYSAHDVTVANTLQALRVFDPQCPPYRSLVLVELRKRQNDYFVTIFYRNSSTIPPYLLQLPGCDKLCPFDKFSELISPLIPDNWEKECRYSLLSVYDSIYSINFIASLILTITFLLFVIMGLRLYRRQHFTQNDFAYQSLKTDVHS